MIKQSNLLSPRYYYNLNIWWKNIYNRVLARPILPVSRLANAWGGKASVIWDIDLFPVTSRASNYALLPPASCTVIFLLLLFRHSPFSRYLLSLYRFNSGVPSWASPTLSALQSAWQLCMVSRASNFATIAINTFAPVYSAFTGYLSLLVSLYLISPVDYNF